MNPPNTVVARGDYISVVQVGIIPELRKRNRNRINDPLERDAHGSYIIPEEEALRHADAINDVRLRMKMSKLEGTEEGSSGIDTLTGGGESELKI